MSPSCSADVTEHGFCQRLKMVCHERLCWKCCGATTRTAHNSSQTPTRADAEADADSPLARGDRLFRLDDRWWCPNWVARDCGSRDACHWLSRNLGARDCCRVRSYGAGGLTLNAHYNLLRSSDRIRCWARNSRVLVAGTVRPSMLAASLTENPRCNRGYIHPAGLLGVCRRQRRKHCRLPVAMRDPRVLVSGPQEPLGIPDLILVRVGAYLPPLWLTEIHETLVLDDSCDPSLELGVASKTLQVLEGS